jgi:HK97 family phage major capsid protein
MAVDNPTKLSDFSGFLTREQAAPIFEKAARSSVVQQLVREVPLSINGTSVPVVTGKLSAGWVAEGAQKPASSGSLALKNMDPKKIATVAIVSAEVVRANPGNYMNLVREQVGEAFARAFDSAALHGTSSPFSTNLDQTTKSIALGATAVANGGVHKDIVDGLGLLVNDGKRLNGFALDEIVEPILLSAVDANGRPIYIDTPLSETTAAVRPGRLIGRNSFLVNEIAAGGVVGYAGDWSQAAWGVVGGISYKVSTEATVTIDGQLVSLFENNLVAILAEAEYGWLVNDPESFVKITID